MEPALSCFVKARNTFLNLAKQRHAVLCAACIARVTSDKCVARGEGELTPRADRSPRTCARTAAGRSSWTR